MSELEREQTPATQPESLPDVRGKFCPFSKVNRGKDVIAITAGVAALGLLFALSAVAGGFAPFMMVVFFGSFLVGLTCALLVLVSIRTVERAAAKRRRSIREVQDRVINNATANMIDDLNQLIDLHMAAKNIDAAEIYSRQLCKYVENSQHHVDEWMIADFCSMATPEHVRSWFGRVVFIFKAQGPLYLSDKKLMFKPKVKYARKVAPVEIPLEDIVSITKGSYSRWAKPIRLDYLEIMYRSDGIEEGITVTPMEFYSDTVWDSNKHVDRWQTLIEQARSQRNKRIGEDRAARLAKLAQLGAAMEKEADKNLDKEHFDASPV